MNYIERYIEGRALKLLLAGLIALLAATVALAPQAKAVIAAPEAGPVNPDNGFPSYYQDGAGMKLDLCLDQNGLCLLENPDPNSAVSFPDNFGPEAFWWDAETTMPTRNGGQALLVMASEAAFGGADEEARDGDQVTFGRVRIRVDNLVPGATYKVTYPYGEKTFRNVKGGRRGINFTQDIGCVALPCDHNLALQSSVFQSFLTWDTFGSTGAGAPPAGYLGDPRVDHKVIGSPLVDASGQPQNYFKIEGPNVGGPGKDVKKTALFSVMGKVSSGQ